MSVPDISGKAIANLEIESLRHVAPTFHGDTLYGETTVLDKWESTSKDDRGVVHVETIGYNQDGTVVCIFRRKVMVPKNNYLAERGGEQPGRPTPVPDRNWPGPGGADRLTVEGGRRSARVSRQPTWRPPPCGHRRYHRTVMSVPGDARHQRRDEHHHPAGPDRRRRSTWTPTSRPSRP